MAAQCRPHNPMPESRYEVLALFTGAMVGATLFVMSTGTLMPFLETTFHLSQAQLGLVLSVQMVGAVVTTSVCGMLTDRYGDKAVVLWTGLFMGLSLIAGAAIQNFTWLLFWLLMYGIGFAAVTPAGSHAIVYFFKKEQRGFAMGVRQCGMPIAGIIGSIVLPAIALHSSYRWSLVAAGIATIGAGAIASALYREPAALEGERASLRDMCVEMLSIARDARLILVTLTSMILVFGQVAVMAFLPLTVVHEAGFPVTLAVSMFTVSQIGAVAGRLSWGWASDHLFGGSRMIPLAVVCVVTAVAMVAIAHVTPATPHWLVIGFSVLLGFGAVGWFGLVVIALAEIGGEEHSGSALGVGLTWTFAMAFAGPTIFGAVSETHGFSFAWEGLAVLQLVGIVPAMLGSALIRRVASQAQAPGGA